MLPKEKGAWPSGKIPKKKNLIEQDIGMINLLVL